MTEGRWQVAGAVVLVMLFATPAIVGAQDSGIAVGSKAPAAVLETLDGKPANLDAWIGKEPLFIEFWATWCSQCKALEPQVLALQKQYAGKMRFIGVSVSAMSTPSPQPGLFEHPEAKRQRKLDSAVDAINAKFGKSTMWRAGGMRKDE